jgi:ABC-type maltose transport system permease subunit
MSIPLVAFLYLYLLFILVWLVFSLIALYHIMHYGQIGFTSFIATFIYLAGAVVILYLSYQYLSQIDWNVGITIFRGSFNFFGPSNF